MTMACLVLEDEKGSRGEEGVEYFQQGKQFIILRNHVMTLLCGTS